MSNLKDHWKHKIGNKPVHHFTSEHFPVELIILSAGMMCDSRGEYVEHYHVIDCSSDSPPNITPPSLGLSTEKELEFRFNINFKQITNNK